MEVKRKKIDLSRISKVKLIEIKRSTSTALSTYWLEYESQDMNNEKNRINIGLWDYKTIQEVLAFIRNNFSNVQIQSD
jgi:hypothetical protein